MPRSLLLRSDLRPWLRLVLVGCTVGLSLLILPQTQNTSASGLIYPNARCCLSQIQFHLNSPSPDYEIESCAMEALPGHRGVLPATGVRPT